MLYPALILKHVFVVPSYVCESRTHTCTYSLALCVLININKSLLYFSPLTREYASIIQASFPKFWTPLHMITENMSCGHFLFPKEKLLS